MNRISPLEACHTRGVLGNVSALTTAPRARQFKPKPTFELSDPANISTRYRQVEIKPRDRIGPPSPQAPRRQPCAGPRAWPDPGGVGRRAPLISSRSTAKCPAASARRPGILADTAPRLGQGGLALARQALWPSMAARPRPSEPMMRRNLMRSVMVFRPGGQTMLRRTGEGILRAGLLDAAGCRP